jgi:choline dehydrogenase-like flavoprotein
MSAARAFDVAVVGGGPAGLAAALGAARAGAHTLLVERERALGGNVTRALVHTICGLYRNDAERAEPLHAGLPRRIAGALAAAGGAGEPTAAGRVFYLPIRPAAFGALAQALCARTPGLALETGSTLVAARLAARAGEASELEIDGPAGRLRASARAVVDASGDAAAAAAGAAALEEARPERLQRASFIVRLEGVEEAAREGFARLQLTAAVARAASRGELPAGCASLVARPDVAPGSLHLTLTLPPLAGRPFAPHDPAYVAALSAEARALAERLVAFLRATREGFAAARVSDWPARVGVRETRRLLGRVVLSREDVLEGRRRDDEVALSGWPIELWEDHRRARFEHPAAPCSVPLGALVSRSHPGLGAAGRCLSASHEAHGALRVIATALATGEAIGVAAALAADAGGALAAVEPARVRARIADDAEKPLT